MRLGNRVRWWACWHPLRTVVACGFLGLVVGNVLATWGVRSLMLGDGVGDAVAGLPGTGSGAGLLLAMATLVVAVGVLPGVVLGGLVWATSVRFVRRRRGDVLAAVAGPTRGDAATDARAVLWRPAVEGGHVVPAEHYEVGALAVEGDEAVLARTTVDAPARDAVGPTETWRVPVDRIEGASVEADALAVRTDGGTVRLPATDPDPAAALLRERGVSVA